MKNLLAIIAIGTIVCIFLNPGIITSLVDDEVKQVVTNNLTPPEAKEEVVSLVSNQQIITAIRSLNFQAGKVDVSFPFTYEQVKDWWPDPSISYQVNGYLNACVDLDGANIYTDEETVTILLSPVQVCDTVLQNAKKFESWATTVNQDMGARAVLIARDSIASEKAVRALMTNAYDDNIPELFEFLREVITDNRALFLSVGDKTYVDNKTNPLRGCFCSYK